MINIAVIGLGWWGQEHVRSLEDSTRARVVCVADPDIENATAFAQARGLPLVPGLEDVPGPCARRHRQVSSAGSGRAG